MSIPPTAEDRMLCVLERRCLFDEPARAAVRNLEKSVRTVSATAYLVREGQQPERCLFLMEGYAYRQKVAIDGSRALVSLHLPDDFLDLQNLHLDESDHDIQALTNATIVEFSAEDLRALAEAHPAINTALWSIGLIEASISREWLLNVGRRDAYARTAHLLCEVSARLEAAGRAHEHNYTLPMTQEQLGDALGLTSVHVNRVLKLLERDGLISRRKREINIADWQQLRRAADFNERYLHFGHFVAAPNRPARAAIGGGRTIVTKQG